MRLSLKHIASQDSATLGVEEMFEHAVFGGREEEYSGDEGPAPVAVQEEGVVVCRRRSCHNQSSAESPA